MPSFIHPNYVVSYHANAGLPIYDPEANFNAVKAHLLQIPHQLEQLFEDLSQGNSCWLAWPRPRGASDEILPFIVSVLANVGEDDEEEDGGESLHLMVNVSDADGPELPSVVTQAGMLLKLMAGAAGQRPGGLAVMIGKVFSPFKRTLHGTPVGCLAIDDRITGKAVDTILGVRWNDISVETAWENSVA